MGNLEMTWFDPRGNDPIIYTNGTNATWVDSMHDVLAIPIVYVGKYGKLMFHHISLSETKSQLSLSWSDEYHEKDSNIVIK
jgi:hypothetical protein